MKFKATKYGFLNCRIYPGDEFDAPEGFSASWAEPVKKQVKEPAKKSISRKTKDPEKS